MILLDLFSRHAYCGVKTPCGRRIDNSRGQTMQSLIIKILVMLIAAISPPLTPAQDSGTAMLDPPSSMEVAPEVQLSTVIRDLFEILNHSREEPDPDGAYLPSPSLFAAVEAKVLPLFDIEYMTKLVLGRNWRLASPEQKEVLIAEFGRLMVQTCLSALTSSHNPTIEFKAHVPVPGETAVTIRSFVTQSETKPWTIDYDMIKTPAGWKVVDIKMEGMRLITIHRDAFGELVRNNGIDGLLTSLAAWNRRGEQRTADSRQHFPAALILMHISTQRGLVGGG
jgi:phospholipid transport system substrate-binding protein